MCKSADTATQASRGKHSQGTWDPLGFSDLWRYCMPHGHGIMLSQNQLSLNHAESQYREKRNFSWPFRNRNYNIDSHIFGLQFTNDAAFYRGIVDHLGIYSFYAGTEYKVCCAYWDRVQWSWLRCGSSRSHRVSWSAGSSCWRRRRHGPSRCWGGSKARSPVSCCSRPLPGRRPSRGPPAARHRESAHQPRTTARTPPLIQRSHERRLDEALPHVTSFFSC